MKANVLGSALTFLVFTCPFAGASCSARAALLANDQFNYTPIGSDLNSQSSGGSTGFSDAWNGQTSFNIGDGSLVSPVGPLPTSGNRMETVAFGGNRDIDRTLTDAWGAANTTRYVSFLIRPDGILHQGAFNGWFAFSLIGSARVYVGMSSFGDTYNLEVSGTTAQTATNAVIGQTQFFVLRIDFTEGVAPVRLYVNPKPGLPEPAVANATLLSMSIDSLTTANLTGPGAFSFDALRMGTTYADVTPIPEPSCLALTTLSIALLFARRDRKVCQR